MRPLLDRGGLLAVAHVRGGGERGRPWWQQGRLLTKRNTFTDFVACGAAPGRRGRDVARPAGRARPAAPAAC